MSLRSRIMSKVSITRSFPATALKAMELLQEPNIHMAEIAQTINYDPGLTSNVLKLANSSMFGLTRSIGSLRDAIIRLGTENVFRLITTSVMNSAMNKPIEGYGYRRGEFWEHSIAVAVCSETLAELVGVEIINLPFTAGLLHDIGKMLLGKYVEEHAVDLQKIIDAEEPMFKAELDVFQVDHAQIGSLLMEQWNLPTSLVDTVRNHHQPSQSAAEHQVAGVVHVADFICNMHEIGPDRSMGFFFLDDQVVEKLGVTEQIQEECVERTRDSLENIRDVFSPKT